MKSNPFNICPTCVHRKTCVLTQQKDKVWSCSEYDEVVSQIKPFNTSRPSITDDQPEMAMA